MKSLHESTPYIPEYCPCRMQTKPFHVILPTFYPSSLYILKSQKILEWYKFILLAQLVEHLPQKLLEKLDNFCRSSSSLAPLFPNAPVGCFQTSLSIRHLPSVIKYLLIWPKEIIACSWQTNSEGSILSRYMTWNKIWELHEQATINAPLNDTKSLRWFNHFSHLRCTTSTKYSLMFSRHASQVMLPRIL